MDMAAKRTEHLIWTPKAKCHLELGHELPVLFTTLTPHLEYQAAGHTMFYWVVFSRYIMYSFVGRGGIDFSR